MNSFDSKAQQWDSNPIHWQRSEAIAAVIKQKLNIQHDFTALEYGAGTGILSFMLKDCFKELYLMDSSREMIKVIEQKVEASQATNIFPLFWNLETEKYTQNTFDIVFNQMVLHHVPDIDAILSQFYLLINKNGYLAIADLYPEDGSFHGEGFDGHLGFDPEQLRIKIANAGFKNIEYQQCFVINKKTETLETKPYPVFLITASK
ncbi:MAG: class I SAM-dependent methyltransferase [Bacteroidales bacterium]|nr:class I SAM-dependent methyltransferase [Bacteroidales bacterium]